MDAEENWHLRMKDWEGSQTVACFVRSGGLHGGPDNGHAWVVRLDATEPNSWGNFTYVLGMSEGVPPSLSRSTKMPSCFGHWSIFKVTLMKTPHGQCTEQSLNLEAMHGVIVPTSHYYRWARFISVAGNTNFFNLLILKILHQAQCHALHIFQSTSMFN